MVLSAADTNLATLQSGGFLTLQSRTRPIPFPAVPGTFAINFAFGFATEELPLEGELLDSVMFFLENTNTGLSAVLFMADAASHGWLPFAPGMFPQLDSSVELVPAAPPAINPLPLNFVSFEVGFTVPPALASGWTDLTMLLYDYPNGLNSISWLGPVTVVPPPGVLDVNTHGLFRSFGPHRGFFGPLTNHYTLTNGGGSSLSWRITLSANWLTATPASGDLDWGRSTNVALVVNNRARSLPPGFYTNQVNFRNDTTETNSVARTVELVVIAPPHLAAAPGLAGEVRLRLTGMPFANYRLEAGTNFAHWTAIHTNTTSAGGTYDFTEPATTTRRLYRASFVYP